MGSVPAFNLTFPATASTILSVLLPEDAVDYLGILSSPHAQAQHVGKISLYERKKERKKERILIYLPQCTHIIEIVSMYICELVNVYVALRTENTSTPCEVVRHTEGKCPGCMVLVLCAWEKGDWPCFNPET
jgi:hypothetical protein